MCVCVCVCVCVLDTCPSLWGSTGEMSGSFSRGSYVQEKKEKKKKRKIGVPRGDVVCVKYLPVRDRDDY